ncbi:hypothetical protein RchiOBHm_Chr3g0451031 [Rosa chinensis]|uniref:Uncharacterized protein n=1 Tax=Rosa chinensis TaxID=74649 RepID=A0A2P6R5Y0_ROSCH|nr:hypothetical protein RchiOBHm_Chr3g0451031 [Rosa chinensis]
MRIGPSNGAADMDGQPSADLMALVEETLGKMPTGEGHLVTWQRDSVTWQNNIGRMKCCRVRSDPICPPPPPRYRLLTNRFEEKKISR